MKLGNHTVGLRNTEPRLDGVGQPVRDDFGDAIVDVVDVEVRWCSMTPTTATSDTTEPQDRSAPALSGMTLLAPPKAGVTKTSEVIWPITARSTVDGRLQLSGDTWQVVGDPGPWGPVVEARLQKSS